MTSQVHHIIELKVRLLLTWIVFS